MAKKKPYRFFLYLLIRGIAGCFWILPRALSLAIARALGRAGFWLVWRQREKTLENLRHAYGREKSEAEIHQIAEKVFENLAQTAVDVLRFDRFSRKEISQIVDYAEAFEVVKGLFSEGKGIIMMSSHIGNWELLAGVFCHSGFRGAVVGRRIYYEPYNRWIVGLRRSVSVETLYRDESMREMLKVLQRNEILGILPDQDVDSTKGFFVDFFRRPAYTMTAPVRIALRSGAPLVSSFLIRQPGDRYRIVVGEVLRPVVTTTREEAVQKYTEQWMKSFERVIREYPEQWTWMHNRWKTVESFDFRNREAVAS